MIFQNFNPKYDFGVDFEPTPPQNRSQNHARGGVVSDVNKNLAVRTSIRPDMTQISNLSWNFRKFSIFLQLSSSRKSIYTCSIQIFLDVLKSYESESFISGVFVPLRQDCDTPWHPILPGILGKSPKTAQCLICTPYCLVLTFHIISPDLMRQHRPEVLPHAAAWQTQRID